MEIKFHLNENIKWDCKQLELNKKLINFKLQIGFKIHGNLIRIWLNLNSTKFKKKKFKIQIDEEVIENLLVISIIHDYYVDKKLT